MGWLVALGWMKLDVVGEAFGVERSFIDTTHAYRGTLMVLLVHGSYWSLATTAKPVMTHT